MLGSPSTSSAFTSCRVPSPWQSGQTPNGELNENCLGSSSGSERPQTGQAKRSEKMTERGTDGTLERSTLTDLPASVASSFRRSVVPSYLTTSTTPSAVF